MTINNDDKLDPAAETLLQKAGLPPPFVIHRLVGGGNNRCFRVDSADGRAVLLKAYFHHPDDTRDRLGHEFAFSRFAWDNGVRTISEPLAQDPEHHLGLYTFLPGRRLVLGEVNDDAVNAALAFTRAINLQRDRAAHLPNASESCFSLADHVRTVERRLARANQIEATDDISAAARQFLADSVAPVFTAAVANLHQSTDQGAFERTLELAERCVSPSDFGFHNALRDQAGVIRFIDFEYAGWDDPAKLVCDFFCQEAVPVPHQLFASFSHDLVKSLGLNDSHVARFSVLLPLYRVKWVCIILNDFLPVGRLRRDHAAGSHDDHRQRQLAKAHAALSPSLLSFLLN